MSVDLLKTTERTVGLSRGELMKARKSGTIPAILFGKGMESIPLFVDQVEFLKMFKNNGKIFEVEAGGKKHLINTKFIHKDPLQKLIYQVDFYKLQKGVDTTVKVPVNIIGDAKGVKAGGVIQQRQETLEVRGFPKNIPESIEVDVTELEIGSSIHISELTSGGKYEFIGDGELTVVACLAPQKEEAPAETTEEASAEGTETAATEETKE